MLVVLTIRNGKTRPRIASNPQRWIPVMTNAASRSDWMKISLVRVGVAPPDTTGGNRQLLFCLNSSLWAKYCLRVVMTIKKWPHPCLLVPSKPRFYFTGQQYLLFQLEKSENLPINRGVLLCLYQFRVWVWIGILTIVARSNHVAHANFT